MQKTRKTFKGDVEVKSETITVPDKTWLEKRLANVDDGGYGTTGEQFEILGEQGIGAYQQYIARVKVNHPKP